MATYGLSEFKEVLSDFRQLGSLALKGAVAAPLADIWLKLGPPPSKVIGALAALLQFLVVVWVFQFWLNTKEQILRVRMKVAFGLFVVGLVTSLVLLGLFSFSPGQNRERIIGGYSLLPDVKPVVRGIYTAEEALKGAEYDPDKVWTKASIVVLRTLITSVWIATFACFAVYLTIFVILQRRRQTPPLAQEPLH